MSEIIVTREDIKKEYTVVGTAVYEYPRYICNALKDLIEVNINNLKGMIPQNIGQDGIAFLAAVEELKKQAHNMGGNAIIGLDCIYAPKEDILSGWNGIL